MENRDAHPTPRNPTKSAMGTAAAMADLCVVARTSACRVAGGLVALEDAGPADALAGRGTEGPGRRTTTRTQRPLAWPSVRPGAPPSQRLKGCLVPDGKAPVSAKRPGPPASFRGQRGGYPKAGRSEAIASRTRDPAATCSSKRKSPAETGLSGSCCSGGGPPRRSNNAGRDHAFRRRQSFQRLDGGFFGRSLAALQGET